MKKYIGVPLKAWELGHFLTLAVYRKTRGYPPEERFAMVIQMRKAAYSVPANLVEGYKREHAKEKARFYNIAEASLAELRYFMFLSLELEYLGQNE